MVCPVCGEALELEGYEVGDLVDCEACGAVLRLHIPPARPDSFSCSLSSLYRLIVII